MFEDSMMTFADRFDAIFDGPHLEIVDEIFAPNFVGHVSLLPHLSRSDWKHYVANLYIGISDLSEDVNEVILGEDRLVLRVTYSGTHDGPLFRLQATGTQVTFEGINIFRFDDNGQAVEAWSNVDLFGLMAQIGAVLKSA